MTAPTDPTLEDLPFTVAFVGWADRAGAAQAAAYEDAVLVLLAEHGARLLYRGRRSGGQDERLPAEVHLIWFPHRAAFAAYLADERRAALRALHGDVFTATQVVELTTVAGPTP